MKLHDLDQISFIEDGGVDDDDEDDIREGVKHRFHRSEKTLGLLYRGVDEQKIWSEDISRAVNMDGPSVWDQLMGRLKAEMAVCGIETEYERHAAYAWKLRNL